MFRSHKPDPYCAFKNDVERRKPLIQPGVGLEHHHRDAQRQRHRVTA